MYVYCLGSMCVCVLFCWLAYLLLSVFFTGYFDIFSAVVLFPCRPYVTIRGEGSLSIFPSYLQVSSKAKQTCGSHGTDPLHRRCGSGSCLRGERTPQMSRVKFLQSKMSRWPSGCMCFLSASMLKSCSVACVIQQ